MSKQSFFFTLMLCMFCLTVVAGNVHGIFKRGVHTEPNTIPQQSTQSVAESSPFGLRNIPETTLKIYPNPVSRGAFLTVEMPGSGDEKTLLVYNMVGKVVWTHKTFDKKVEFQAPGISGIYLLRFVEGQNVIAVEKIVVKE